MMLRLVPILALILCLPVSSAMAQDLLMHDSVYYTLDDGVQSPEEMELEADQIYQFCKINHFQNQYYKCECLAGAFLQKREALGPMVLQSDIMNEITKQKPVACANTENIAGNLYQSCMSDMAPLREMEKDNPQYCECVANMVASDFEEAPVLSRSYTQRLTYNAMLQCNKPENRQKKTAAKTAN